MRPALWRRFQRRGGPSSAQTPYVGSCGALDMVNFGALETVRNVTKDQACMSTMRRVTLMRTTADENRQMGEWIGVSSTSVRPVRFLLPEGGVASARRERPSRSGGRCGALCGAGENGCARTADG
ncbi:MAG: Tm-1-like ATP-binding domain-containing protein [Caldilineaceae bacterium]